MIELPAEARFLLQTIQQKDDAIDPPALSWDNLLELAKRHSVVPLLYNRIVNSRNVPAAILEDLRSQSLKIAGRNAVLKRELISILKLLLQNGFEVLPYKGPVLVEQLYGNIALRHFDDLDILVHKKDFVAVKALLLANGFEPKRLISKMTPSQEKAFLASQYTYDFVHIKSRTPLEVHWAFLPKSFSLHLDVEAMWRRCSNSQFETLTIPALCPEDLLLILCIMGAKKSWERLSRVCDVFRLIQTFPHINWDSALQRAKEAGAERILLVGLSLGAALLELRIDERIVKILDKDTRVKELTRRIIESMFVRGNDSSRILQSEDQFQPMHFLLRERFTDRVRYCYRLALTPGVGEWKALSLPGFAYWLYYAFRPIRLTAKALQRMISNDSSRP